MVELNRKVGDLLPEYPGISARQVGNKLGCSAAKIIQTSAWIEEMKKRKSKKSSKKALVTAVGGDAELEILAAAQAKEANNPNEGTFGYESPDEDGEDDDNS